MPQYPPSDTVGARGLRSALIRRTSRHDKSHESKVFFQGKAAKIGVMNHDFFVMIHDKKNTIQDKNLTNRDFFRSLGKALKGD